MCTRDMIHKKIHSISGGYLWPSIALQVQNHGLKHQPCHLWKVYEFYENIYFLYPVVSYTNIYLYNFKNELGSVNIWHIIISFCIHITITYHTTYLVSPCIVKSATNGSNDDFHSNRCPSLLASRPISSIMKGTCSDKWLVISIMPGVAMSHWAYIPVKVKSRNKLV